MPIFFSSDSTPTIFIGELDDASFDKETNFALSQKMYTTLFQFM